MQELLAPYLAGFSGELTPKMWVQLAAYLKLLLHWNSRTNLTSVRKAEDIVTRHIGESLFAGVALSSSALKRATLLDLGSGAGFPGLPIQILHPELAVTLAESQGKKVAFLREAVRTLEIGAQVYAGRAEEMEADRKFGIVTLRAVDNMDCALAEAVRRTDTDGLLVECGGSTPGQVNGMECVAELLVPGSTNRFLRMWRP